MKDRIRVITIPRDSAVLMLLFQKYASQGADIQLRPCVAGMEILVEEAYYQRVLDDLKTAGIDTIEGA